MVSAGRAVRRPLTGRPVGQALGLKVLGSPSRLPLSEDELHIWTANLDRDAHGLDDPSRLLSPDEHTRAGRFRFERDRSRYTAARALLRVLLGRYLGRAPERITFRYGRFEKPLLTGPGPWFNLSHSGPIALYAVSSGGEVGIDVELDHADFAQERIAERFFSPAEVRALRALPEQLQPRAFLTCWTRKEAFIKARGDGLSLPLDSFDVTLVDGQPPEIQRTAWSPEEARTWGLIDLSDGELGYIAAAATRVKRLRVIRRQLTEVLDGEHTH